MTLRALPADTTALHRKILESFSLLGGNFAEIFAQPESIRHSESSTTLVQSSIPPYFYPRMPESASLRTLRISIADSLWNDLKNGSGDQFRRHVAVEVLKTELHRLTKPNQTDTPSPDLSSTEILQGVFASDCLSQDSQSKVFKQLHAELEALAPIQSGILTEHAKLCSLSFSNLGIERLNPTDRQRRALALFFELDMQNTAPNDFTSRFELHHLALIATGLEDIDDLLGQPDSFSNARSHPIPRKREQPTLTDEMKLRWTCYRDLLASSPSEFSIPAIPSAAADERAVYYYKDGGSWGGSHGPLFGFENMARLANHFADKNFGHPPGFVMMHPNRLIDSAGHAISDNDGQMLSWARNITARAERIELQLDRPTTNNAPSRKPSPL